MYSVSELLMSLINLEAVVRQASPLSACGHPRQRRGSPGRGEGGSLHAREIDIADNDGKAIAGSDCIKLEE